MHSSSENQFENSDCQLSILMLIVALLNSWQPTKK